MAAQQNDLPRYYEITRVKLLIVADLNREARAQHCSDAQISFADMHSLFALSLYESVVII